MNSWMWLSEPKIDVAPWSRPTKHSSASASRTVPVSQAVAASPVTSSRARLRGERESASVMAVPGGSDRRGQQVVVGDTLLQGSDPMGVVPPLAAFGVRSVLPVSDRFDEALLEVAPVVMAELRQRERQAERPPLPLVVEVRGGLVGGAGFVQPHDTGPARATPIMDSVVTRFINISSVKSSVPEGRSGITNQREWPLLSQTLISVSSGRSTPISPSTLRGSRAARDRNTGSLYQYGGSRSSGHGKHEHSVQMMRLCTPGPVATAWRGSPSAPAMPSGRLSSAIAAGVSSTTRAANSGSVQAFTTIFRPFSGVISDSKYDSTLSTVCPVITPFSIRSDSRAATLAALDASRSLG